MTSMEKIALDKFRYLLVRVRHAAFERSAGLGD